MNSLFSYPLAGIFGLGGTELLVIFLIILLLFGGAKLPSLAKGLGQSIREFKKASNGEDEQSKTTAAPAAEAKKPETSNSHGSN
ncbi:MAG: twin-arginine translocase TatA/TatE family subunit [Nibricoccus sp.]